MFLILSIATIGLLGFWIYKTFAPYFETIKHVRHRGLIFLEVLEMNLNNSVVKMRNLFRNFDTAFLGPFFIQVVREPEDLKIIFNSDATFEKTIFNRIYFNYGLFSEGGESYRHERKILSPLFAPGRLRKITPIINENMSEFIKLYERIRVTELVDFNEISAYFALSSSLYTLFNVDIKDYETLRKAIKKTSRFLKRSTLRIARPWLYPYFIFKRSSLGREIWNLKLEIIRILKLDKFKLTNGNERDGLKFYYDYISKTEFDPKSDKFIDSVSTVLSASFVTTSDAISSTLLLLAMNPEGQEILYNELKSVLNSCDDFITEEECDKLPYLGLVLKESLRLLPSGVAIGRKVTSDLKLTKYTAKAGSFVIIPMIDLHTDPKIWGEDSLEFKPQRFLEENMTSIHPYAYFPFSKGPRICPGYKHSILTLKIFLCRFLMKYRVSTPLKYDELTVRFSLTLTLKEKHMMKVELRQ